MARYIHVPMRPNEYARLQALQAALTGVITGYHLSRPSINDVIKHLMDEYERTKKEEHTMNSIANSASSISS